MKQVLLAFLAALTLGFAASGDDGRPDPSTLRFVGCRWSAGECSNSCATRRAYWERDPSQRLCPFDPSNMIYACWCIVRRGSEDLE